MRRRGNGVHEATLLPNSLEMLLHIRNQLIAEYSQKGYTFEEHVVTEVVPDGAVALYQGKNSLGDNRDTTYLSSDYFQLTSDNDVIVFYGVNHTYTKKSALLQRRFIRCRKT